MSSYINILEMVICHPILISWIWSRVILSDYPGYGPPVILYYYIGYGHVSSYIIMPDMVTSHPILLSRIWTHVIQ